MYIYIRIRFWVGECKSVLAKTKKIIVFLLCWFSIFLIRNIFYKNKYLFQIYQFNLIILLLFLFKTQKYLRREFFANNMTAAVRDWVIRALFFFIAIFSRTLSSSLSIIRLAGLFEDFKSGFLFQLFIFSFLEGLKNTYHSIIFYLIFYLLFFYFNSKYRISINFKTGKHYRIADILINI